MMKRTWMAAGAALLLALALTPAAAAQEGADDGDLLPVGMGSLNQDDLAIRLRNDELEIRFAPLDERLLRLLAPDSYRALHSLRDREQAQIDSISRAYGVSDPGVVFVSFHARQSGARFEPQLLSIGVRSRQLYPIGIIPLSPSFSSQQLELRQQASAIYLYEDPLPINEPATVSYAGMTSSEWERKLATLERERARIGSRVGRDSAGGP